jgi:hypothetical protein
MQLEERLKPREMNPTFPSNGKNSSFKGKARFSMALLMLPKRHE